MTTDQHGERSPDIDRILADVFAEDAPPSEPPLLIPALLARTALTRQRPAWRIPSRWLPASVAWRPRPHGRLNTMATPIRIAAAAAVIGVLAVVGGIVPRSTGPGGPDSVASPSPSPTASPIVLHQGSLAAGDYTVTPFLGNEWAPCAPAESSCPEAERDDAIRFTFTVPEGWAGAPLGSDIWLAVEHNSGPAGAGFLLGRGGWLYSEPCSDTEAPDIPVGPTVDDFVGALVSHPLLEATEPIETKLSGNPGQYLEIQAPTDIASCPYYQAWAPTFYAQGASNLWPIWVLDVDGVRVVVQGSQFPGTAPERVAELRAIVESIRIDKASPEPTDPSPASSSVP